MWVCDCVTVSVTLSLFSGQTLNEVATTTLGIAEVGTRTGTDIEKFSGIGVGFVRDED